MDDDDAPSPYDDCGATLPDSTSVLHPGRPHYCVKQTGHEKDGDRKHRCERICEEEWTDADPGYQEERRP